MPMKCDIVTQDRMVFTGEVDYVGLPGTEGYMGILPNHSALLTTLGFGEVVVKISGEESHYAIGGGMAEVTPDKVIILADSAEQASDIDLDRAQKARERAEKEMTEGVEGDDPDKFANLQAQIQRAQVRIDTANRRGGGGRRSGGMTVLDDE